MFVETAGVVAAVQGVLILVALVIIPRGRRPSAALAWILLIIVIPFLGALLFVVIGSPKLPRKRRDVQRRMSDQIEERAFDLEVVDATQQTPAWLSSVARLNESVGAMPLLDVNHARLLPHVTDQLAPLIDAVESARPFVHLEFFVFTLDATTAPLFAALEAAVARGVAVRVLLDHLGSSGGLRATRRELQRMGAEWALMLPVQPLRGRYQRPDLRIHRKLVVVDGRVAFVGSLNIIDPSYDKRANRRRGLRWRDLLVELQGPVVHEVDALFVTDWYSETGMLLHSSAERSASPQRTVSLLCQIAPSGPAFEVENNLMLFNTLIYSAQRRFSITSPYFVPDESLLNALTTAARRGVAVELFVGEISDQFLVFHAEHSYYGPLLEAGVRIYRYPAPEILHAKHMSVDELVTVVGSSNMDIRSFALDFELTLMTCGQELADQMRDLEDEYRAVSRELTQQDWQRRSMVHGLIDDLARLTSAVQ